MQEDPLNALTSGYSKPNPVGTQESPHKSFPCSRCILRFKSRVYLFEHLNKVHGCDVEASPTEARLTCVATDEAKADGNSNGAEDDLGCEHCHFKACSRAVLNRHEMQCLKKAEGVGGNPTVSENLEASAKDMSAEAKEIRSVVSVVSTSKSKNALDSSKVLKTYKRPLQTITKYFTVTSGPNKKPPADSVESPNLPDKTEGTVVLKESPSNLNPNRSGVLKVTHSMIDITRVSSGFLLNDQHMNLKMRSPKPGEQITESLADVTKRTNSETSKAPSAKRAKSDKGATNLQQAGRRQSSSSNAKFSFDLSEDEGEKKLCLVNGDSESATIYSCKHCNYNEASVARVSTHYQTAHPYVRFNAAYIQDPTDDSAVFRCLVCPCEFIGMTSLKNHCRKDHPEAPNIFAVQSTELSLTFKCFLCVFTTDVLNVLKKHYKKSHPAHKVDNSLLFCKYIATECQEGSTRSNTCEKAQSAERPGGISPKSSSTGVENAPSAEHPTSKGADVIMYHCEACKFSHKSAVVMHVHYQKSHPSQVFTIDQIKQSACDNSHTSPSMTPEKTITEESQPPTSTPDPSEKTANKAEPHQKRERRSEASKARPESPKAEKAESTKGRREHKDRPRKRRPGSYATRDSLPCVAPGGLLYCQVCSYSSTKVKSVLGHHNAKHSMDSLTCVDEILCYSAQVQKKKLQSNAKASAGTASSDSKEVGVPGEEVPHKEEGAAFASVKKGNAYACAEKLFYCQKCNYGNPSLKGVAIHQTRVHKRLPYKMECVVEHTAAVCAQIEKSKLDSSARLPLPIMCEGDEDAFFCHLCNFRQSQVNNVLRHYMRKHPGLVAKHEQVYRYTTMVREKTKRPHVATANHEDGPPSLGESLSAAVPQRNLRCTRCPFSTKFLHILRMHLWNSHRTNRSFADLLRVCFKQGDLQTGYHCEVCVFSHEKAAVVHKHYLERHPKRYRSLRHVTTHLYVGPDSRPLKRRKRETRHTDGDGGEGDDGGGGGGSPSQRAAQSETKNYSCRACAFKGASVSAVTRHYRAVHPWSVKEDGSVLGVVSKRPGANRSAEDSDAAPESFGSHQMPVAFKAKASSKPLACYYCPARFRTRHGLNTHCGMKHVEVEKGDLHQHAEETQAAVSLFTCPYCPYMNIIHQGILSHCHVKHVGLEARADDHQVDEAQVSKWMDSLKTRRSAKAGNVKLRGYMCGTCPQICVTMEKLNEHCEAEHGEAAAKPAPTSAAKPDAPCLSKICAAGNCQYCTYSCSSKIVLARHVRIHHAAASVSKAQHCAYKCLLCSSSYRTKKLLGNHYFKRHGRDGFLKYYAPLYKGAREEQASGSEHEGGARETGAATSEPENLLVYRCPSCPYVNTGYHGMLTHCQMKHPDVVTRADQLRTVDTLRADLVGFKLGRAANERGYMCTACPLIYGSLKKMKAHHERDHGAQRAAREHSASSASEGASKSKTPAVGQGEKSAAETRQSNATSSLDTVTLYKCHMCSYKGVYRRYLLTHYKKTHKLDAYTTRKLLKKYNKCRKASGPPATESQEGGPVECIKCPGLVFDSAQTLVAHYAASHSSDGMLDFTVISQGTRKGSTGLYRCVRCSKRMNGIRKLWYHLDCHRESARKRARAAETTSPKAVSTELDAQDEPLPSETVDEAAQRNGTSGEPRPPSPLEKPADQEQPGLDSREGDHTCTQCQRSFMSLRGLRSHERSHAAMAALKKLNGAPASGLSYNINKYVLYKAGTTRPFLCSFCSYRTTFMGLWRCHFMKVHQDFTMDPAESDDQDEESVQKADKEPSNSSEELTHWPDPDEELDITERSLYLEPPDVQRQLNHYSSRSQADCPSETNAPGTQLPDSRLLHCEFCTFNTEHLSSMRRHYLNRHGKKVLRCKDCDFFTSLRKTLEMHMQVGHSTWQPGPTHERDLRCPFCLYQTKNKNNMIDHIVLHREERVVPIEVRRPVLSRYLRGVVFRCHKCTFSCGGADKLRSHMARHDDVRPYRCRLCYFDCTRLSDLEAHLGDKHQVVRNHELVGQVSLDQLQAAVGRMPEEEPSSNLELRNDDSEDEETEGFVTDCKEGLLETQAADVLRGGRTPQTEEASRERGWSGDMEESPIEGYVWDLQSKEAEPNTAALCMRQKEEEKAAEESSPTRGALSVRRTREKAVEPGAVTEAEAEAVDALVSPDGGGVPPSRVDAEAVSALAATNLTQADNSGSLGGATSLPTFSSKCAGAKTSDTENSGLSFKNCKEGQAQHQKNISAGREPYGEMPVLEKEYLKEELQPIGCCKEEDESGRLVPKREEKDKEDEEDTKDKNNRCTEPKHDDEGMKNGSPHVARGAAEEKRFTCEFCGRHLANATDLERHVARHGL
uniref:C2H2-type domain-containing protein n=1 Tax=Gasterosteus aculeatus aculeatus TaxID=481459 RepID=A0AAQ4Q219_GASAC|nr:zinc finger protein 462-like [Gasterosteus aculeatus aculeatus]XP_040051083.1 zinc finger protein 462-like [Gasterosteus aculeatus aculeatus]